MSIENIKSEFNVEVDKIIAGFVSLPVLKVAQPNKSQQTEQTAILDLIDKLQQAKIEMAEALDVYANEYYIALNNYYTDQVFAFETKFRQIISDNLVNIRQRKATVVNSHELSALSIVAGFPHTTESAIACQKALKQALQSTIDQLQIDFASFKAPDCFIPSFTFSDQDSELNNRFNTRLATIFSNALQKVSKSHDSGIPFFRKKLDEHLQSVKKSSQEAIDEADDSINKMYGTIAYKTRQIRIRNAEAEFFNAVKRDFEIISQKVNAILKRIDSKQEDDTYNIIEDIMKLDPSLYSFQLPKDFKYYQDKINFIAMPINKLKAFHLAYSDKQIELVTISVRGISNKVKYIEKLITALNIENIENRPAQIRLIIAKIEQVVRDIAQIEKPKYLCSVKHTQQYEKLVHALTNIRTDLQARMHNLKKILQMHVSVDNASLRYKDREQAAASLFNGKKTITQLCQQSFESFNQYDVTAFTKLEQELKTVSKPRKFELEYTLFKSSKKMLIKKVEENKRQSQESTKKYNTQRNDAILAQIKEALLGDARLAALAEHAVKIMNDGEKGRDKAKKIKLLKANIENAATVSELIDIISGKSSIHKFTLSEITKNRGFFGFGKVTSSKLLADFQESAKRIIDGGHPSKQVPFK